MVGVSVGGKVCVTVGVLVNVGVELTNASCVAVISASDRAGEQDAVNRTTRKRNRNKLVFTMFSFGLKNPSSS
jgi:hypothetical protein